MEGLDPLRCYRAVRSRDPRFDGRFFSGVTTTGVYCRPICPARTPRREHMRYFACAAAAEDAGFRPCRRCRPETAPGTPAWLGSSTTVRRALRLIGEGALEDAGVETLAARLGVGARQLRRLFAEHLGTSPRAVARTRRVHLARRLIDESELPMAQVALAAGFRSLRQFNHAIQATFQQPPTALRRAKRPGRTSDPGELVLRLPYRAPLAWDALLDFFAPRATPGVESVGAGTYRRAVGLEEACGWIEVRPGAAAALELRVHLSHLGAVARLVPRVRRLFDLETDPHRIGEDLSRDPVLARRVAARPGLRVPGAFDPFELVVRAILGQQVSVKGATTLAGRLVRAFGKPLDLAGAGELSHRFPDADALAEAPLERVGLPRARARAIRSVARATARCELSLDGGTHADTRAALMRVPGVGPWTVEYVAMRALGEPDAFPAGDLALRKALAGGGRPLAEAALRRRAEAWRPWRAYAAVWLLAGATPPQR